MNANQQTLNLTTMKTRKTRVSFYQTSNKWVSFLNELKNELENNSISALTSHIRKHKVSNSWATFLKTNNSVYMNASGHFKWNNQIVISRNLIDAFREYQAEVNEKYYADEYIKTTKVDPSKVIKVKPKMVRKNFKNTETKQIGLIRKFLKWIY